MTACHRSKLPNRARHAAPAALGKLPPPFDMRRRPCEEFRYQEYDQQLNLRRGHLLEPDVVDLPQLAGKLSMRFLAAECSRKR